MRHIDAEARAAVKRDFAAIRGLKVSRGDEGVGHVCFPEDEVVGRAWRGYRCVQMNAGPA